MLLENDRTTEASRAAINPTSYIDKRMIINICGINSGTSRWFKKKTICLTCTSRFADCVRNDEENIMKNEIRCKM